ncbi:hypothetical protein H1Z61_11375 [Bacillus aquiflavi]|uniref:DUF4367 domain-containing protein n=1 Tax=Bacillus aquiflavi TaxID=2672567 RepID=A0A6B3VXF1_9BACI|nr:hypothetical protein [Bacillus aquiflavi]MBA4537711.1 hypothetical protein [Bacillus aquiflavi]NEY81968.1 hypothetical protein [Bacillus aquiflavi]UAC47590.1 hypothetical protein K6959_13075 [Bacillus aquiflavi]
MGPMFRSTIFMITILVLSACSVSVEEQKEITKEAVTEVFKGDIKAANKKNDEIEFYMPDGVTIKKEMTKNNIVFEKGLQTFILFYNPNEGSESEVVYQSSVSPNMKYLVNETFKANGKFGFLLINETEHNKYELTVGIGGVKVTTETKAGDLVEDAKMMVEMASSVKLKQ